MLIRNRADLPTHSDIYSMVQLYFQTRGIQAASLLATIKRIDKALSAAK